MEVYAFGQQGIPANLQRSKTWRLANRIGEARCFYSDMELLFYLDIEGRLSRYPRAATREHLVPKKRCTFVNGMAAKNTVLSSALLNNLLGDAPLPIKFEVRHYLMEAGLPLKRRHKVDPNCLTRIAKDILNRYRIANKYPWQLTDYQDPDELADAIAFMVEMTESERILFAEYLNAES